MTQKLFLTSALAMGVMAPAMAEPERVATFPNAANNEFMQENKVYTDAATSDNMAGVYEDGATVDAVAQYTDILYNIVAGNYLEAGSDDVNGTQCPQNSYCPGLTNATYNETADQGLNSCPSEYGLSAAGSDSQNDCYRTCTNADVEHSMGTMNGGYYYGDNNQCEPTDCVNGWHVKAGQSVGRTLYSSIPNVFQNPVSTFASVDANGSFSGDSDTHDKSFYGIANNDVKVWSVYYGSGIGIVRGKGVCSTHSNSGERLWQMGMYYYYDDTNQSNAITDETGQAGANNCWCQIDGYMPDGGILQNLKSSSWWLVYKYGSPSECANGCAGYCGGVMAGSYGNGNPDAFVEHLFYAIAPGLASCEANTITINWGDTDDADITANEAGTATYGEDIRTPVKAHTKAGKRFTGWRFSKPEQTNLP